jgi:hypothetical protein
MTGYARILELSMGYILSIEHRMHSFYRRQEVGSTGGTYQYWIAWIPKIQCVDVDIHTLYALTVD